jgi:hypothetical protein
MKILLIILILITFSYLFYLFYKRKQVLQLIDQQNKSNFQEGMTDKEISDMRERDTSNALTIINKKIIKIPTSIQDVEKSKSYTNLHLHNLCIKGTYNSGYSGSGSTSHGYISLEMVKYMLYRGCRYLDFQIFYMKDDKENQDIYVGYSNNLDDSKPLQVNLVNIKFNEILETVIKYGLQNSSDAKKLDLKYLVPNINDPIFIQLRIHPKSSDKQLIMSKIEETVNNISGKSYNGDFFSKVEINKETYLKDIMKKIIFVFEYDFEIYNRDKTFYNNFMNKYSIIYLNNGYFRKKMYSDVDRNSNRIIPSKIINMPDAEGNIQPMIYADEVKVVCADNKGVELRNVDIFSSIVDYNNNINLIQYYVNDTSSLQLIQNNENMFDSFGFSFIPMYNAMLYIDSIKK